ncbi:MAG: hypothetical protein H6706_31055 [Myxococcales bacterium]|nr:hypothetical protein [Myxococcales bacterium]
MLTEVEAAPGRRYPALDGAPVRAACIETLPRIASTEHERPRPGFIYVPRAHLRALDPDSAVVTGVRGAGKTFWWETLADPLMLKALDSFFPSYRLATYEVLQAFGPRTSEHWPHRLVFDRLIAGHDAEIIWRAVLLRRLGLLEADDWASACEWVNGHVEEAERRLLAHDRQRAEQDRPVLVVFDGLDQVASRWTDIYALLRGLLRLIADLRLFRGVRAKAFLRHDMVKQEAATGFTDASKLLTGAVNLDWPVRDLYGALFQRLGNAADAAGQYFRDASAAMVGATWASTATTWHLPSALRNDELAQRHVLSAITGPWAGRNERRGVTYTWLPAHLADAYDKVSPRSLFAALHAAAAADAAQASAEGSFPIPWQAVREGVKVASQVRVDELCKEEYPWVRAVFEPLRGQEVPIEAGRIVDLWKTQTTLRRIGNEQDERRRPARLAEGERAVVDELVTLGIFSRNSDGRLQMPDLYRVAFGLRRRGGLPPVQ